MKLKWLVCNLRETKALINKSDSADNALGIKSVARISTRGGCKKSFAFVKTDRFHAYACSPRYLPDG
jgi:hypothetical protein